MNSYSDLWQMIKLRICQNSSIPESATYGSNNYVGTRVKLRTLQIFTLECVLHQYRQMHATSFNPMEGEKALHHLIFDKTKWLPNVIRALDFNDALFVIKDEMKLSKLPDDAKAFIDKLNLSEYAHPIDDFPATDWDPKENAVFLRCHS
jgi:hypothetical protein